MFILKGLHKQDSLPKRWEIQNMHEVKNLIPHLKNPIVYNSDMAGCYEWFLSRINQALRIAQKGRKEKAEKLLAETLEELLQIEIWEAQACLERIQVAQEYRSKGSILNAQALEKVVENFLKEVHFSEPRELVEEAELTLF